METGARVRQRNCVKCGEPMYGDTSTCNGRPCHISCPWNYPPPVADRMRENAKDAYQRRRSSQTAAGLLAVELIGVAICFVGIYTDHSLVFVFGLAVVVVSYYMMNRVWRR
jgi:hypothetical protein